MCKRSLNDGDEPCENKAMKRPGVYFSGCVCVRCGQWTDNKFTLKYIKLPLGKNIESPVCFFWLFSL